MEEDELFDSDSSDGDYVPSGGEVVSEEDNSGEEEDLSLLGKDEDDVATGKRTKVNKTKKKVKKTTAVSRKRQGGIAVPNGELSTQDEEARCDDYNKKLTEQINQEKTEKKEEKKEVEQKKKSDSLWADFMKDVGRPKPKANTTAPANVSSGVKSATETPETSKKCSSISTTKSISAKPTTEKVTITKEYDFAGEIVKITEQVDASSKEAQVSKQEEDDNKATSSKPTGYLGAQGIGIKRPGVGGLGSVLGKIGKKQKMSTLEKSKLDWNNFKQAEGIDDELKIHNKGKSGYIERKQFLERTDLREFEQERELRIKTRKPFMT